MMLLNYTNITKEIDMKVKKGVEFNIDKGWEVKIRRVENGFILSKLEEMKSDGNEPYYKLVETIFEDGAGLDEIDGLEDVKLHEPLDKRITMYYLIHSLLEEFDCRYNNNDNVNLRVDFEIIKEDEVEEKDKFANLGF